MIPTIEAVRYKPHLPIVYNVRCRSHLLASLTARAVAIYHRREFVVDFSRPGVRPGDFAVV